MIRNILSRLSLLARFTLVSFLLTIAIASGLAWRLESILENDALSAVAQNTADQAANILDKNLSVSDFSSVIQGERYNEIDGLIHNTLLNAHIVRIKLWNRAGMIVYSDDQAIIGHTFPPSAELQKALQGEIA